MFLLIDKPKGVTSHDVVNRVRALSGERRVGHGGTLDPNATGLIIIGVGRESTKKLSLFLKEKRKEYVASIVLGEERDTDDIEGKVVRKGNTTDISSNKIKETIGGFVGEIEQTPPTYSAIKVGGKKSYEVARKGEELKIKPRKIVVYKADILEINIPYLKILFEVSSGTYIRALARDIGRKIGCMGYLSDLRRTKIGSYKVENAIKLDCLNKDNISDYYVSF